MTKKERVMMAIKHQEPDKVPKGEIAIVSELTKKLIGEERFDKLGSFQSDIEVRNLLNMDIAFVNDFPTRFLGNNAAGNAIYLGPFQEQFVDNGKSTHIAKAAVEDIEDAEGYTVTDSTWCPTEKLDYMVSNTDMFVVAQIGGPVSNVGLCLGMEDFMVYCLTNTDEIKAIAETIMEYEIKRAKVFIDHGADAILLADDIAFNSGPFLPPHVMDQIVFPFHKYAVEEIKKYKDIPVFLHTDGYVYNLMDKIVECGFDGLQSLQPSAGMDIAKIKKNYGDKLCLMGNLDLDYLLTFGSPAEVEEEVKRVIDIAAPGGGFILSSCNILVDMVKPENALTMYNTAEVYSRNKVSEKGSDK